MVAARTNFSPGEHANILVAGDVMLDRYVFGSAGRISPEAPVPVVAVDRVEERPGGAANVAANVSSLGVRVTLAGITGDDGQPGSWSRHWRSRVCVIVVIGCLAPPL